MYNTDINTLYDLQKLTLVLLGILYVDPYRLRDQAVLFLTKQWRSWSVYITEVCGVCTKADPSVSIRHSEAELPVSLQIWPSGKLPFDYQKIAQNLPFFSKKIAKNFHFFQKNCHWQFKKKWKFWHVRYVEVVLNVNQFCMCTTIYCTKSTFAEESFVEVKLCIL